jgi:uncharacterized protein (TIGR00255 family)
MSIRSMTGFARVRRSSAAGEVVLTVKSVNHRGLDIHFHMSDELDVFENALRAALKRHVLRGHFQVRVVFTRSQAAAPALNRGLLEAYFGAFRQAASEMGIAGEPDLNTALALPGMFREDGGEQPEEAAEQFLVSAMEEAVLSLNAFREREGQELAAELTARASAIRDAASRMQELRAQAAPAFQARLSERLAELLGGAFMDPQRLVQEAAILADRSDISEELTRLRVHTSQLEALLAGGGEIGKKLDFLLQEMGREANTILSKTGGVGDVGLVMTEVGLAVKAEIEKIREQALNLE